MKSLKKILFVFLALTLAFCLFACGGGKDPCKTHADGDNDGKCDKCGETVEVQTPPANDVVLVEDGEANFQIVYSNELSENKDFEVRIRSMRNKFRSVGIDIEAVVEATDNIQDCEILIGNITTRADKYKIDGHDYGMEGYVIKIVDSKIIINAGSEEALGDALDEFLEDIIEIDDDEKDFDNLVMLSTQQVEEIQDDYKITSLSVGGKNMKDYTIALNKSNTYHMDAAKELQQTIYERVGYWLELVDENKASDTSVVLKAVAKDAVEGGIKISTNAKKQLVIECGYDNSIKGCVEEFLSEKVVPAKGALDLSGTLYTKDVSVVYYSDFGAKGDGKTEDFFAIKAAHDFANISGQLVKADKGKTYYIHETREGGKGSTPQTITIKTNVDWGNAKFIIDDSDICTWDGTKRTSYNIFYVMPDTAAKTITTTSILNAVLDAGLNRETTKIDLGLGEKVMIVPSNSSHKVYRRLGYGVAGGKAMHEVIVIDENGNVDPETPVMFDYTYLDKIDVYSVSDEPITIEGGEFTTKASNIDIKYLQDGEYKYRDGYIFRAISIERSNTTMKNIKHYITGEITLNEQYPVKGSGKVGPPYQGFFYASNASHVTIDGCVLSGRRCYPTTNGTMGTYGYTGVQVNKFVFKNCVQHNFFISIDENYNITPASEDTPNVHLSMEKSTKTGWQMHWGLGNTNFCKNFEFIDSTMSRFDAHEGLYNGKIINSTVETISLVGGGDMIVENSRVFQSSDGDNLFSVRKDYGSTWDGKIKIDGLKTYLKGSSTYIIAVSHRNFYFGYQVCFPSIEINNLDYYDLKTKAPLNKGFEVWLCDPTCFTEEPALHLDEITSYAPYYHNVDKDGDGYIDGIDDVKVKYDASKGAAPIQVPESRKNVGKRKPPEIIKITGNDGVDTNGDGKGDGGYVFIIPKTAGYGASDGGYYDDVENYGGFFGDTKFITDTKTYLGTNHKNTETFKFQ